MEYGAVLSDPMSVPFAKNSTRAMRELSVLLALIVMLSVSRNIAPFEGEVRVRTGGAPICVTLIGIGEERAVLPVLSVARAVMDQLPGGKFVEQL